MLNSSEHHLAAAKLIREHSKEVKDGDASYIVRIYGEERTDGTWEGWFEFHPTDKSKPVLRTAQETSQPNYSRSSIGSLG